MLVTTQNSMDDRRASKISPRSNLDNQSKLLTNKKANSLIVVTDLISQYLPY